MARKRKTDNATQTVITERRERDKNNFLSDNALEALESGTYGQKYGRQAQSYSSQDQAKIANPVPALDGMFSDSTWQSSLGSKNRVNTENARAKYAERINYTPLSEKSEADDSNYVVKRDRYDKLMQDSRLANDIKTLAMVNHNNANQDATVSQEWADEYGAKAITGGFSKSEYLKTLSRRYGLTPEELNDMALTFHSDSYKAQNEAYGNQLKEWGKKDSLAGSAASLVGTVGGGIEGLYNTAVGGIGGGDRYLSNIFSTTKNAPREGAKENMKTDLGRGAYDVFMGIGDMAAGAAVGSAPLILAGNTANTAMESAMDRGSSVRKAAAYGAIAGAQDFVTNKIGLDEAKKMAVKSIKDAGIKQFLAKNAIAGLGEAGENIIQDIGQSFVDDLINGKNSELQLAYNSRVASGMSNAEALKETALDYAKQVLMSGAIGFGMGSAMQAGATVLPKVPELAANKWADIKMGKVGAVDPNIATILNMETPVNRTDIRGDSVNLQPDMGISDENSANPANTRVPVTENAEKLQTPVEKPAEMDLEEAIGEVIPEAKTGRNYSDAELAEIRNYAEARDAIRAEMDKSVNMFDMNAMSKLNDLRAQGKAMDAEMAEKYPELFNDRGKFEGIPEQGAEIPQTNVKTDANKQRQLDIINRTNPAPDDQHAWVRSLDDIKTFEEAWNEEPDIDTDFTSEMAEEAMRTGKIRVYSSYDIEDGTFVTPSYMEALAYAGDPSNVKSAEVNLDDVAWIDSTQGQLARGEAPKVETAETPVVEQPRIEEPTGKITEPVVNNGEVPPETPLRTEPPRSDETGESRVVTNSAINANIISRYDYKHDAQLQDIAKYAKANNELTYENALENVQKNGAKLLDEYNTDQRVIDNDQDVDQAMLLLRNLKNQLETATPEEAKYLTAQRNMLLSRLRKAGTKYGQTIQAFAKWNDTADGAINNGESMNAERTRTWESQNQEQANKNKDIASKLDNIGREEPKKKAKSNAYLDRALAMQGDDGSVKAEKNAPKTHEQIREEVENSLKKELGSIAKNLTETDIDYYTNLVENRVPLETIVDEIEHRLNHGEFYTIDESIEEPKQLHSKLLAALNSLVDTEEVNPRQELSLEDIRTQVKNTLEQEAASIGEFTDEDVNYLANLIRNGATKEELAQALNTKMATGRFGISADTQFKVDQLFAYADKFDPNSKQACEAKAAAYKLIAEEVVGDASPFEKFEAWRYLAMLGNPKTMLRNFVGNTLFNAVTSVSNGFSAIGEGVIDKTSRAFGGKGIQRTKAILNPTKDTGLIKGAWEDASDKRYKQLQGAKYEKSGVKDKITAEKSVFNNKILQLYEKATDKGISDYSAIRTKYSTSLAGWMKANGLDESAFGAEGKYERLRNLGQTRLLTNTEKAEMADLKKTMDVLEKGRDFAVKQAEYATFHEDNAIATALSEFSRKNINSDNKVRRALGYMMEGVVPFKKTPANILRSGFEYSPLGAIKSIADTGKLIYENTGKRKNNLGDTYTKKSFWRGNETEVNRTLAADVIDSWSKTLTGTGLAYLGYYLMDKGILNSSTSDEKYQDELEGLQNYSITINGKTYTLDWAAPAVMPLLLGAEMNKIFDRNAIPKEDWYKHPDKIIGSINSLLNPVFETSMLQGIQNVLESAANEVKYNEDGAFGGIMGSMATNALTGYYTQAIPTLSGQIARTVDNTRRTSDTIADDNFLAGMEKQGRKLANKIPFLSRINTEYVDAYGNTQTNSPYNNPLGNLAYQMLSPAYIRDINTTDADIMARNAYNAPDSTGVPVKNKDVFAPWKGKVTYGGEKLDPQQLHDYREASGKASYEIRDALAHEDWFKNLDGQEQTSLIKKVNTLVNKVGLEAAGYPQSSSELDAYKQSVPALINKLRGTELNKDIEAAGLSTSSNAAKEAKAALEAGDAQVAQQIIAKGVSDKDAAIKAGYVDSDGNARVTDYNNLIAEAGDQKQKMTNDLPVLAQMGMSKSSYHTYANAIQEIPSLTPQEFAQTYNEINVDPSNAITQKELLDYINSFDYDNPDEPFDLWYAYGKWENKNKERKRLEWDGSQYVATY